MASNNNTDVVLHIGAPKAGSSAIQHFCLNNRDRLEQCGYYYPLHGLDSNGISGGHGKIGLSVRDGQVEQARALFTEYIKSAKEKNLTLLLSSESFYPHAAMFKKLTGSYRGHVISLFRDPAEFLISMYNQSVKRHYNTESLSEYCQRMLNTEHNQASGAVINDWLGHFGEENITVLEYLKPKSADAGLEKKFLEVLGIDSDVMATFTFSDKPINRGYSDAVLEFKRRLNFVLDKDANKQNAQVDQALQYISDQQSGDVISSSTSRQVIEAYHLLNEKFKYSNKKIRQAFFNSEPSTSSLLEGETQKDYTLTEFATFVAELERYNPAINRYVKDRIWAKLNQKQVSYFVLSLADIFGLPLDGVNMSPVSGRQSSAQISKEAIKKLVEQSDSHPLLLEACANLLEQQGKLRPALALARKAYQADETDDNIARTLNRVSSKAKVLV